MQLLTNIAALLLVAPATGPQPAPAEGAEPPGTSAPATAPIDAGPVEVTALSDDYQPPFPSEELELSAVLERSLETNLALANNAVDIRISETTVLAALGAYDVFINAGITGTISETPQRGSALAFALGQRSLGANFGVTRKLETGGSINASVTATRTLTEQPINLFNASAGSFQLAQYQIQPSLTLTHPLLRGMGLRVNRADINKARIAVSQAEATRQLTAETMVRDIVSAYWTLLFAHRDLENKRRSVELARKQLERTQALVAAGRQSPVEAKAVEQALAAREGDVINAENALLGASLDLRTLMGESFSESDTLGVVPATDPLVRPRPVDLKTEIDNALAYNPQVRQLQLGIESRRIDEPGSPPTSGCLSST